MNSRERVLTALNHQEPDRVPLYFGGTSSFLTDTAYYKLKEYLGIHGDVEPYRTGHTGNIFDQRILEALDVDVRFVVMKIGIDVRRVDEHTILSDWGIPLRKVDGYGVRTGPPFSDIDVEKEGEVNRAIEAHPWPNPYDPRRIEGLEEYARELQKSEKAIVARSPQSASVLEYGCWLRGDTNFYIDLILHKPFVEKLLDKILDVQIQFYDALLNITGKYLDIVETAEDYGTQSSLLVSPETFREFIKPRRKKINDFIKGKCPQVKVLHHSCGAIAGIIDDLIETGVDVINPLQPKAERMDPVRIKTQFGARTCFCGGIDMQEAMVGDLRQVEDEVRLRIAQLAPGGGYLLCTSNHVQRDIPPENVVALFQRAGEYGVYG